MSSLSSYNSSRALFALRPDSDCLVKPPLKSKNLAVVPFAKMHALGNDFIVINAETLIETAPTGVLLKNWAAASPALARQLCSRHFGIGADGLILAMNLEHPELRALARDLHKVDDATCQLSWTYTNADGSPSKMCANGLRCLALWAHEEGLLLDDARVLTAAGPVEVVFTSQMQITVDLGQPALVSREIPFNAKESDKPVIGLDFEISGAHLPITCVNMGNPHCVIYTGLPSYSQSIELPFSSEQKLNELPAPLSNLAQKIQSDPRFPEGVNVSMILSFDRKHAQALVFERGCGPTLACGSAAAAILVAGVLENKLERHAEIVLPGGALNVTWSEQDNHVKISGPANYSFSGQVVVDLETVGSSLGKAALGSTIR